MDTEQYLNFCRKMEQLEAWVLTHASYSLKTVGQVAQAAIAAEIDLSMDEIIRAQEYQK